MDEIEQNEDAIMLEKIRNYMRRYYEARKKLPRINLLIRKMNITPYKAREYLRKLEYEGFLHRKYNQYSLIQKQQEKEKEVVKKVKIKKDYILLIIRVLMGIIGAGAVILSIYYTAIWLMEFLEWYLGILLSTIMVAFSVMAFETMLIFNENKQKLAIVLFGILWIVVLLFSMMSTVAGQYNKRISNEKVEIEENVEIIHKKLEFDIYDKEEKELESQLKEKGDRLEDLNKMISEFDLEKSEELEKKYKDTYSKIYRTEREMRILRNELKVVRDKKRIYLIEQKDVGAIQETAQEYASFYVWVSAIFKAEVSQVEFWLSVFPAVFIDIIAPLAIGVSMFLRRRKKEDEI